MFFSNIFLNGLRYFMVCLSNGFTAVPMTEWRERCAPSCKFHVLSLHSLSEGGQWNHSQLLTYPLDPNSDKCVGFWHYKSYCAELHELIVVWTCLGLFPFCKILRNETVGSKAAHFKCSASCCWISFQDALTIFCFLENDPFCQSLGSIAMKRRA